MLDATLPRVQDVDLRRLFKMEFATVTPTKGKAETIFETVLSAVNFRRHKQGGGVLQGPRLVMREVLAEHGITPADWQAARERAKRVTPNLFDQFEAAFGRSEAPPAELEQPAEPEVEAEAEPSTSDCLANAVAWIERAPEYDRRRIVLAVAVFFAVPLVQ